MVLPKKGRWIVIEIKENLLLVFKMVREVIDQSDNKKAKSSN